MWTNKLSFFALLSGVFLSTSALCEYRVYQYFVKSRFHLPLDQKAYLVTSTLDPVSYLSYHGGNESIKIELLRSWMCKGDTGEGREICPAPLELSSPPKEAGQK